jgi:hypothetical protein
MDQFQNDNENSQYWFLDKKYDMFWRNYIYSMNFMSNSIGNEKKY